MSRARSSWAAADELPDVPTTGAVGRVYGVGGMQPAPPVFHWQAGLAGPAITCAVVSITIRPARRSALRKSRNAVSLARLMEYAPQCPPVPRSHTLWNTYCTQSVDWLSASAFSTYFSRVASSGAFLGLGGSLVP